MRWILEVTILLAVATCSVVMTMKELGAKSIRLILPIKVLGVVLIYAAVLAIDAYFS